MKKCKYCKDPILKFQKEILGYHDGCFSIQREEMILSLVMVGDKPYAAYPNKT